MQPGCKTYEPKRGQFGPQGHNSNKLGRCLLGVPRTKYQGSMSCGFRQDFFHVFPIKAYVKYVTPWRGHFMPQGHNLNKLTRGATGLSAVCDGGIS